MGKRISNLPSQPELTPNDFLVIDGENGTRKVQVDGVLVRSGSDSPSGDFGVDGSMYVKYVDEEVVGVFFKTDSDWMPAPVGGGSKFEQMLDKDFNAVVTSTSTITVTGEVNP